MSNLVLGTVALGIPYGIDKNSNVSDAPIGSEALDIFQLALANGISCMDTAPSYGISEEIIGKFSCKSEFKIWTKLSNLNLNNNLIHNAYISIDHSLSVMGIEHLACLQWHNWDAQLLENKFFLDLWNKLSGDSRIKMLGASTYGVQNAIAAVQSGLFSLVQIEWNLLNQSVLDEVEHLARVRDVKLALRSVLLQGILTPKGDKLPTALAKIKPFRDKALNLANHLNWPINALALRAALDHPSKPLVLIGPDRLSQLSEIIKHANLPALDPATLEQVRHLSVVDPITDPRFWKL